MQPQDTLLAWTPGFWELMVIGVIALIIFGRRLPDVARSLGKSVVEFKRGLNDVKDDVNTAGKNDAGRAEPPTPRHNDSSQASSH